jgi:hypothetical protein
MKLSLAILITLAAAAPIPRHTDRDLAARSRGCGQWTAESCHWVCFAYGGGGLRRECAAERAVECVCHSAQRMCKISLAVLC